MSYNSEETDEEYAARMERIRIYTENFNKQQAPIKAAKEKERKKREHKAMLKNAVRVCFKTATIGISVGVGYLVVMRGGAYIGAVVNNKLDFDETDYKTNENIQAGYYNEHHVRICVSNEFSENEYNYIKKGLRDVDKVADGLTFDIFKGNESTALSDIQVKSGSTSNINNNVGVTTLAYATLGNLDAKKISGYIVLDTSTMLSIMIPAVISHECCHALGLTHTKDPNSLMFPMISRFTVSKDIEKNLNTIYPDGDYSDTTTSNDLER